MLLNAGFMLTRWCKNVRTSLIDPSPDSRLRHSILCGKNCGQYLKITSIESKVHPKLNKHSISAANVTEIQKYSSSTRAKFAFFKFSCPICCKQLDSTTLKISYAAQTSTALDAGKIINAPLEIVPQISSVYMCSLACAHYFPLPKHILRAGSNCCVEGPAALCSIRAGPKVSASPRENSLFLFALLSLLLFIQYVRRRRFLTSAGACAKKWCHTLIAVSASQKTRGILCMP